ncbi:unnamed protein product [Lactuca saligna]|uniref:Uncharacterized protein n=1 Tax=Lactuca saligna TaxID=75948 RepID=A0AA35VHU4_LACSI|nr:unnamed protein product [Lactuca saligna]
MMMVMTLPIMLVSLFMSHHIQLLHHKLIHPPVTPNKMAKPSTPIALSASPFASSPDGTSIIVGDLAFKMKKALQSLTKGYTIPQCLERLEVLQLGPTDPLRFVAYHIFGGTMNTREM